MAMKLEDVIWQEQNNSGFRSGKVNFTYRIATGDGDARRIAQTRVTVAFVQEAFSNETNAAATNDIKAFCKTMLNECVDEL